jgi:LysM repeat protein
MALKGTSLLAIATRYSIALQRLLDINELEEDGLLDEDQLIFLQKKSTKGDRDFVLVRKTEMLYSIAQNNGIQLESLLAYNHLKEDGEVFSGTKLFLKPVAQSDKKINSAHSSGTVFHNVKAKEGLFAIAQKYSVSVAQLRDWNKLSSDYLQIGQQLIVSQ